MALAILLEAPPIKRESSANNAWFNDSAPVEDLRPGMIPAVLSAMRFPAESVSQNYI
jgi:hypothetical protein